TVAANGPVQGEVRITSGILQTLKLELEGSGPTARLTLSPSSWNFGQTDVFEESAEKEFVLANEGNATLALYGVAVSGEFSMRSLCLGSLAPADSCAVYVKHRPMDLGESAGYLSIQTDTGGRRSTSSVRLAGEGQSGKLQANPASLSFDETPVGQT